MGTLNLHYVGTISSYGDLVCQEGRFFLGGSGYFIDGYNKLNNIVIPAAKNGLTYTQANSPNNGIYVSVSRQEVFLIVIDSSSLAYVQVFDFHGTYKYTSQFVDPISYARLSLSVVGNEVVAIVPYNDGPSLFLYNHDEYTHLFGHSWNIGYPYNYNGYGTLVTSAYPGGIAVAWRGFDSATGDSTGPIHRFSYGKRVSIYTPSLISTGNFALAAAYSLSVGVFHGLMCYGFTYSSNLAIDANNQITAAANSGFPVVKYGNMPFDLQFPPGYQGVLWRGCIFFVNGIPFVLIDGGVLFSAVWDENFSHHNITNFARGVPIAGTKA